VSDVTRWLLQRCLCDVTAGDHQQVAKGDERGRSSCHLSVTLTKLIWSWTEDNNYYTTNSTGWMSTRGLNTSSVWWWTSVCMTGRLSTSLTTSSQPLVLLLAVFVYDLLTGIVSLFLAADLARTAVGLFITLARQSRTRCQMNLETRTALAVLNNWWNNSFQPLLV